MPAAPTRPRIGISLPVRELTDDIGAIVDFATRAEALGFTHLRIPEQIVRRDSGHLHEPLTFLAFLAGKTERIGLVPSILILPARQTALVAKQAAEIDVLSGGRLRLGVGVGFDRDEYRALGVDFSTRGRRCSEQMALLRRLWTEPEVSFTGEFDDLDRVGIDPLPVQRPIPQWVGGGVELSEPVLRRIAHHGDGWFALCEPEAYAGMRRRIESLATEAGRDPGDIGGEASVAAVGVGEAEWLATVGAWAEQGVTHLCMRTLGAGLDAAGHLSALERTHRVLTDTGWMAG
ncbi:MAG: LLM class F420-dependent oxidoreductase [Actinomycetota bacterium]|nr:LLM class F420-dependent oxidoreductase [Actinomycetota bacterium]